MSILKMQYMHQANSSNELQPAAVQPLFHYEGEVLSDQSQITDISNAGVSPVQSIQSAAQSAARLGNQADATVQGRCQAWIILCNHGQELQEPEHKSQPASQQRPQPPSPDWNIVSNLYYRYIHWIQPMHTCFVAQFAIIAEPRLETSPMSTTKLSLFQTQSQYDEPGYHGVRLKLASRFSRTKDVRTAAHVRAELQTTCGTCACPHAKVYSPHHIIHPLRT